MAISETNFHAVSVALYGHERCHSHVHLLAAIEVLRKPAMPLLPCSF